MAIYLLTEHLDFEDSTRSLSITTEILENLNPPIYPSFTEISTENPPIFTTHRHFSSRFNATFSR